MRSLCQLSEHFLFHRLMNFLVLWKNKVICKILKTGLWLQLLWGSGKLLHNVEWIRSVKNISFLVWFWGFELWRFTSVRRIRDFSDIFDKTPEIVFKVIYIFLNFWHFAAWMIIIDKFFEIKSLFITRFVEFISLLLRWF